MAQGPGSDPDFVLNYLSQIEELAEDVLIDKQRLIELDGRRQKTREAMRAVQKDKSTEKMWICMGNMFIKFPRKNVSKMLDNDFDELNKEINNTQKGLKTKVEKLNDAEQKETPRGFHLNPLTKDEMRTIKQYL